MNLSIYAINYTKEGMSQAYDTPSSSCCWKIQDMLLEETEYVVETVSIVGRTTAVVRLHNS